MVKADLKICQAMCAVTGKVPYTVQVFLLGKKCAKSRVTLSSRVGRAASWKSDSSKPAPSVNCITADTPGWRDTDAISMEPVTPKCLVCHHICPVELT